MKKVTRREVLSSVGIIAGTSLLSGCHTQSQDQARQEKTGSQNSTQQDRPEHNAWIYVELDPALVAKKAYQFFPDGGCMYALTGSILTTLGDMIGEPYRSFPFEMMRYGEGGTGGWGSLCGALNGAAAIIGLFRQEKEKERKARLIDELFSWYETAELPKYQPNAGADSLEILPSMARSVLCHVSLANWCKASEHEAFSPEKKERCRRLTADVVIKTVELLNCDLKGACTFAGLTPDVKSCIECHGKSELADSFGKMNCHTCHTFTKKHPD